MAHSELPATTLATLASRIGAIPGCHLNPIVRPWAVKSMKPGETGFKLVVDGWSPSLHRVNMEWRMALDPTLDPDTLTARAATILGHKIIIQRERALAGLALGHAFPLHIGREDPRIEHLHVDASALAFRIAALTHPRRPARDALHVLGHRLQELHNSSTHDGSPTFPYAGVAVHAHKGVRTLSVPTDIVGADGARITHGGHRIEMEGRVIDFPGVVLADTIVAALPGRPLFSIGPIGPLLDMRTIESAIQKEAGLTVRLTPAHVAIADVWDLERDAAIDLLTRRIAAPPPTPGDAK